MLALKLRLNEEKPIDPVTGKEYEGNVYAIGLPILLCSPIGGDFDGDTVAIHLVPADAAEDTLNKMSPRYINTYKKNNNPIYVPEHEVLNGLADLTQVSPADPSELDSPKEYYTSWKDLVMDAEINKTLPTGKPITFTGKIEGEDYKSVKTTYGRLKVSKAAKVNIDKINIFSKPWERISAKSGAKLYQFLYQYPDGVERIQELQRIALLEVTRRGVVTFDLDTLYADTNTETYEDLRKIHEDPSLSDKQKLLMMTSRYERYCKEVQDSFSDELKDELKRADRVKLTSIADMVTPQIIISGVDQKVILNHGTLYNSLTEDEYRYHAVENRSILTFKTASTPSSGLVMAL